MAIHSRVPSWFPSSGVPLNCVLTVRAKSRPVHRAAQAQLETFDARLLSNFTTHARHHVLVRFQLTAEAVVLADMVIVLPDIAMNHQDAPPVLGQHIAEGGQDRCIRHYVLRLPTRYNHGLLYEDIMAKSRQKKRVARAWTKDDVKTLRSIAKDRLSGAQAAKQLRRTPGAVAQKAMMLGIRFRSINRKRRKVA